MNQNLRVSFESPQCGWMSVRLLAGDGQRLVLGVSHAPYDSLRDLLAGLSTILIKEAKDAVVVRWNCEPEEYDFRLRAEGERMTLDVVRYPDHRRREGASHVVFSHGGPVLEICEAFRTELRALRGRGDEDAFSRNWRCPFPQDEWERFDALVEHARSVK